MVPTPSMVQELEAQRFINLVAWSRGVDTNMFTPERRIEEGQPGDPFEGLPRPIFLNVGRVAVEKNIEAFAELKVPGTKVIVGDGPQLEELKKKYADKEIPRTTISFREKADGKWRHDRNKSVGKSNFRLLIIIGILSYITYLIITY